MCTHACSHSSGRLCVKTVEFKDSLLNSGWLDRPITRMTSMARKTYIAQTKCVRQTLVYSKFHSYQFTYLSSHFLTSVCVSGPAASAKGEIVDKKTHVNVGPNGRRPSSDRPEARPVRTSTLLLIGTH